jgi:hypothetical protein
MTRKMPILNFIKTNAKKSLTIASALALISFVLFWIAYRPTPQTNLTTHVNIANQKELKPESENSSVLKNGDIPDLVAEDTSEILYLNPEAPCPPQQLSCTAKQNDYIRDQSCPSYKPIWSYLTKDNGLSWVRVGCFATQVDANKALSKAMVSSKTMASGTVKNSSPTNAAPIASDKKSDVTVQNSATITPAPGSVPTTNSIQDIFNNPYNKPASAEKQVDKIPEKPIANNMAESSNEAQKSDKKTDQQEEHAAPVEAQKEVASVTNETNTSTIEKESESENEHFNEKTGSPEKHPNLTVRFKLLFGLIPVEKRTYPNEEMRDKAISMWKRDQKLLEPDGTINEKYAFRTRNENTIMRH